MNILVGSIDAVAGLISMAVMIGSASNGDYEVAFKALAVMTFCGLNIIGLFAD